MLWEFSNAFCLDDDDDEVEFLIPTFVAVSINSEMGACVRAFDSFDCCQIDYISNEIERINREVARKKANIFQSNEIDFYVQLMHLNDFVVCATQKQLCI